MPEDDVTYADIVIIKPGNSDREPRANGESTQQNALIGWKTIHTAA